MRKCSGNNTEEWGFDSIFEIACPQCGHMVEFCKDEIKRNCSKCGEPVPSDRAEFGCGQWCSASSTHTRNLCPKFIKSKHRYMGHFI